MSFVCGKCKVPQPPGIKPELIPVRIRCTGPTQVVRLGKNEAVWQTPWQIVEEQPYCPKCVREIVVIIPEVVNERALESLPVINIK